MPQKAPGKYYRQGLSLPQLMKMFPNEAVAEQWFAHQRWPHGPICPVCQSDNVQSGAAHRTMPYRCRECRKRFSVRMGTVLENSRLDLRTWAMAIYILTTGIKGTSSMKLHRDLGITQKSAWYLAHRIRETRGDQHALSGPVEVDETYIGGKEANKHASAKIPNARGGAGKEIVVGMKSRETRHVVASVVPTACAGTLQRFVRTHSEPHAQIYSDQNASYAGLRERGYRVAQVNHSVKEYVRGMAHTNGIESFWALLKRGYMGTYHKMSPKQLQRYVNEFAGRHNARSLDTAEQMAAIAKGLVGKRLPYRELTA